MTKIEFVNEKISEPDRESKFGFHFIQLFNANKYEFFLRYVRGWQPEITGKALIFGGAIHTAREWWYKYGIFSDPAERTYDLVYVFQEILRSKATEYASSKDFNDDLVRGKLMLEAWATTWAEDLEHYDILHVEETWDFTLGCGFPMTIKLDDLRRSKKTGTYLIGEAKTTSWSIDAMARSVFEKDQRTQYALGVSKVRPEYVPLSVMPDIMYSKGSQARSARPAIFQSTPQDLALYELQLSGLIGDLAKRLDALWNGIHPAILFPRNGDMSSLFGSVYSDIPRELAYASQLDVDPPFGFKWDARVRSGLLDEFWTTYSTHVEYIPHFKEKLS